MAPQGDICFRLLAGASDNVSLATELLSSGPNAQAVSPPDNRHTEAMEPHKEKTVFITRPTTLTHKTLTALKAISQLIVNIYPVFT